MHPSGSSDAGRSARVLIIGGGLSGIGLAIRLRERGITDLLILERAAGVGGTWRDNAYPGCACDVESALYSFSFAPNPDWSRVFAPQPEILAYVERLAREHGVLPRIRFNEDVAGASWDSDAKRWRVRSTSGEWFADVLVMANGALSDPVLPEVEGLDRFGGPVFHTARWDPSVPLDGKRVAVVGTGASAIQVVPAIQPRVQALVVVQRTPAWVMPRRDRAIAPWRRALYRALPLAQRAGRLARYLQHEVLFLPFRHAALRRLSAWVVGRHLERQVRDPALREALRPRDEIGCKRILLSDDYYPALTRPNVRLVPSALERVEPGAIVTADGARCGVDVLILATGFRVTEPLLAPHILGRSGRSLADAWQGRPTAYMSTTVNGFPNLFILMGPNAGLGHSSVLLMAEAQYAHIVGVLDELQARGARAAEPYGDAQLAHVNWLDHGLAGTVWATGCRSWYLDRTGRNAALWPYGVGLFRRSLRSVRVHDYEWS